MTFWALQNNIHTLASYLNHPTFFNVATCLNFDNFRVGCALAVAPYSRPIRSRRLRPPYVYIQSGPSECHTYGPHGPHRACWCPGAVQRRAACSRGADPRPLTCTDVRKYYPRVGRPPTTAVCIL